MRSSPSIPPEIGNALPAIDPERLTGAVDLNDINSDKAQISCNDFAYNNIKQMILSGKLGPGRKLVHEELAASLSISRTPVREALERLSQEGFAARIPRRGFYVAEISEQEAIELYGARLAIETYALEQTLARGPVAPETIKQLSDYVRRYNALVKGAILKERILVDVQFHLKLADLSGNRYLVRLLAQAFERLTLKRRLEASNPERRKQSAREHQELMEAIASHNEKRALKALKNHIQNARNVLVSYLHELS